MTTLRPAVLVSHAVALESHGGGVQRCTREYCEALREAGFDLRIETFEVDRRLPTRLRRRIFPRPHRHFLPPGLAARVASSIAAHGANLVFLNHSETGPLAAELRTLCPQNLRIVMLSHGLDSTDLIHECDIAGRRTAQAAGALGRLLFTEMGERPAFDAVFCLSEIDLQIERWLGSRRVCLLPRIVANRPLPWQPAAGRMGTVSTLDHPPNREGLEGFLIALSAVPRPEVRLRLVGGPESLGHRFAARYPVVDYLGPLPDDALEREAASWAVFVNPIFRFARGCSTKLAQPLSWRIPVATTRAGARGYRWDERLVPLADDPAQLARLALDLARPPWPDARQAVTRLAEAGPGSADIAQLIRTTLASVA